MLANQTGPVRLNLVVQQLLAKIAYCMRTFGPGTRAKRWSVLSKFRQEIQGIKNLEILFCDRFAVVGPRIRKSPASIFLSLVDNLPRVSYLDQSTTIAARRCPSCFEVSGLWIGKGLASILLGLVDNLASISSIVRMSGSRQSCQARHPLV